MPVKDRAFQQIMSRCEVGVFETEDWNVLKTCFIQNAPDDSDRKQDDAPHQFYENKSCFEYNMIKLKDIGKPITRLNAQHNNKTLQNTIQLKHKGFKLTYITVMEQMH